MNTTHDTGEFPSEPIPFLGPLGPLLVLVIAGEERGKVMYDNADVGREVWLEVFGSVAPVAGLGLLEQDDRTMARWLGILGHEPLNGDTSMLPSWAYLDDRPLTGITRVLQLPLFERMDCFLAAMWAEGMKVVARG